MKKTGKFILHYIFIPAVIALLGLTPVTAQSPEKEYQYIDLSKFGDGIHHWYLYSRIRSTERLDSADITGIADNLLAYQNDDGGWPKNIDWLAVIDPDSVINDLNEHYRESTLDNRNTFPQIEYLSAVYQQTGKDKYREAAEKGFQYILDHEHKGGGWRGWDADVITFNDDVMTGVMELLLDVKHGDTLYNWLTPTMRRKLMEAYARGLNVILDCQIVIDGKKTGWCQQHDFETHAPAQGRSYEHPSVSSRESGDVILFLMKIKEPDSAVCRAIRSAVEWLKEAEIKGYRYEKVAIEERPYHETTINYDRVLIPDPTAKPVWARFYDLEESKPFLSLRSGTIVYQLNEIPFDRRVGYAWYGYWPEDVIKVYPEWAATHCSDH